MSKENYSEIVGQDRVKRNLTFFRWFFKDKKLSHLFFVAPRGCGKTLIAQRAANIMKRKKTIIVNCSTIKNVKSFLIKLCCLCL
jgi:Holliday junction resolvasome RuvABC ATP-dependent DNA helicase subunit